MRYDVDTAALRDDVTSIGEAVLRVQKLGIADELAPIAAALPGGRCAPALREIAALWAARVTATRGQLQELGRCLDVAATTYDAIEQAARRSVGRPTGGSR